ncbi:MAG: O-antigen ligase family protein [bacterium]|nr:O-antigen ligase family protein [bacterium]
MGKKAKVERPKTRAEEDGGGPQSSSIARKQASNGDGLSRPPDHSVAARLGQVLGLICIALLPLASGGFSGWGYQLGFVLLPLAAALCLPSLRMHRVAAVVLLLVLFSPLLVFSPLFQWTHGGLTLWFSLLAIPCGWIIARSMQLSDSGFSRWLYPTITTSAALTALTGLFPWWGHWLNHGDYHYQIVSTFGLPNAFAGFLLLALPVAAIAALQSRSGVGRALAWIAVLLLIATLLLTGSRGATIVLALQVLAFIGLRICAKLRWGRVQTALATAMLLALPIAAAVFAMTRLHDYSMQGRLRFWDAALQMFADNPLSGVGIGGFAYAFPQYQPDWRYYSIDPHSWLLQLPAELGVLGVFIALACVYGTARWILRCVRAESGSSRTDEGAPLDLPTTTEGDRLAPCGNSTLLLCTLAVLGSLLHAAFDFDYTFAATTALLGVLLALGSLIPARTVDAVPVRATAMQWLATGALLVAVGFGQLLTLERFMLDELRVAPGAQRQGELLRQAVRLVPWNERTQLMLAEVLAAQQGKNSREARAHVERSIELEPRMSAAWALRAALQRSPELADADFEHAIALDPYNHPEFYFAWAAAAQTPQQRYDRLKLGVERIPAEHPITPQHVRAPDWYRLNPLWLRCWQQLAELETDPEQKKKYEDIAGRFRQARDEELRGA